MLQVEVYYLSEGVNFGCFEAFDKLGEALFELRIYIICYLDSEPAGGRTGRVEAQLTNYRFKAILPIKIQTALAWKFDWVDYVDAHFDQALHYEFVLLELWPGESASTTIDSTTHAGQSLRKSDQINTLAAIRDLRPTPA